MTHILWTKILFALFFSYSIFCIQVQGQDIKGETVSVFIGYVEMGWRPGIKAERISSISQFESKYGTMEDGFFLYPSVKLFFQNGGGACYIVPVGNFTNDIEFSRLLDGLKQSMKLPVHLVMIPDAVGLSAASYFFLLKHQLELCANMGDRFALLSLLNRRAKLRTDMEDFRANIGAKNLDYGAAYFPWVNDSENMLVPPIGAIAGIITQSDRNKGVWKAPANVQVLGIKGLDEVPSSQDISHASSRNRGAAINPINFLQGKYVLWGARTLEYPTGNWSYISTKRMAMVMTAGIQRILSGAVFEPNDANTWSKIEKRISDYLNTWWRNGALAGSKKDEGFFVKCGLGKTMTVQDIQNNMIRVEVGFAPLKPAEFVFLPFQLPLK